MTRIFFKSFGPCFLKNSIWSKQSPIPKIGDLSTPFSKVHTFYQFWYNFESWRDFAVEGEYNLDDAGNRYEKRQMLKENKKMKATLIKEEKSRMMKLVNLAYKHDPRIREMEEKMKVKKEKERKERLEQKLKDEKEEAERQLKMKIAREEELKRKQEEMQKEKDTLLDDLRALLQEKGFSLTGEEFFQIQINAKNDNLRSVMNELEPYKNDNSQLIKSFKSLANMHFALKFTDDSKQSTLWMKDEIVSLQKAVKKFPAGTKMRWEKITEMIKTKPTSQIIQFAHILATSPNIKFEEEPIDLNLVLNPKKKSEKSSENEKKPEENKKEEVSKEDPENWSEEQQKALENALKKFPSSLPANERWAKIGQEVSGKTKKQCVDRYKHIAQLIKNKQDK